MIKVKSYALRDLNTGLFIASSSTAWSINWVKGEQNFNFKQWRRIKDLEEFKIRIERSGKDVSTLEIVPFITFEIKQVNSNETVTVNDLLQFIGSNEKLDLDCHINKATIIKHLLNINDEDLYQNELKVITSNFFARFNSIELIDKYSNYDYEETLHVVFKVDGTLFLASILEDSYGIMSCLLSIEQVKQTHEVKTIYEIIK